jgi:predicted nucleotide-binding protein (sugar kinase/HSP70/actin superfamily)
MMPHDPVVLEHGSTERSWKSLQKVRVVKAEQPAARSTTPAAPRRRTEPEARRGTASEGAVYRAYKPRPFTREERNSVTVLFGGLHWRAERVIQGALENLGYRAQILPTATREDLLTGREVADIGQCCPTSFTTGNLANFLRREAQRIGAEGVAQKYVYVTAGSCGACRFGQYHQSYELALRNVGMESFRLFLLGQDGLDQGPANGGGLEIDMPFTLGAVWAIVLTDLVQDMEYQIRAYEKTAGETERVARESVDYLYEVFRKRPQRGKSWSAVAWHLGTNYFTRAMREVRRNFDRIEVERLRVKPIVKITGEFYLQTVEGEPNYNIHRWLEAEGAEVYPAPISVWLDYLLRLAGQEFEDHIGITRGARLKFAGVRSLQSLLRWTHTRMRHALNDVPRALPDQYELRSLAAPYYHSRLNGGEGDMLIGKALWAHLNKKAHMTCELSPYSCMPNTMSIGAMGTVLGRHPDLLYAPLEVKGDAEVHALSRCQMILTEAKKRAQREYEQTLEHSGLSGTDLRRALEAYPELSRATWALPHYDAVGTAANLVRHIATLRRP